MPYKTPDEFMFSPDRESLSPAREFPGSTEFSVPPAEDPITTEFSDVGSGIKKPDDNKTSERHDRIKRAMMLPLAATVATVSVVFAAFEFDPLGSDVFASSSPSSFYSSAPTTPDIPADADGYVHVTLLKTGEEFVSSSIGQAGLEEAKQWVLKNGGDPQHMKLIEKREVVVSRTLSDDAVYVGDIDDLDNIYLISGSWIEKTRTDWYYEAGEARDYDDAFPALPNLDPDFAGNYAWSSFGSEEYLVVDGQYLVAGTYYTNQNPPVEPGNLPGAAYDRSTNTLTLTDYHGSFIDANLMGNGFTIRLVGENSLGHVKIWGAMYGGSVTFTGTGSITINEDAEDVGLYLEAEDSASCVMIDRAVTVDIYGEQAIVIHRTTLEKAIYALRPIEVTGGNLSDGEFVEYTVTVTDEDGNVVLDENGQPMTEVKTVKDIAEYQGVDLYDYSVVGSNGLPSGHVRFSPK